MTDIEHLLSISDGVTLSDTQATTIHNAQLITKDGALVGDFLSLIALVYSVVATSGGGDSLPGRRVTPSDVSNNRCDAKVRCSATDVDCLVIIPPFTDTKFTAYCKLQHVDFDECRFSSPAYVISCCVADHAALKPTILAHYISADGTSKPHTKAVFPRA